MIGRAYSADGTKYNVVILAGGNGTRMGEQSDYIPKALSLIGNKRAIDYIIERYYNVAHKFIIGTCRHADLLESYVKGRFPASPIEFSREDELVNNAVSTLYCLDYADSRYGTIILFCDLIVISNPEIKDNYILVAGENTKGNVGTFRHTDRFGRGILGHFVVGNTSLLKATAYHRHYEGRLNDLTEDVIMEYSNKIKIDTEECLKVYEFGNENDLQEVRRLWEDAKHSG